MEAFESAWLLRANDDALSLTEYVVRVGRTVRTAAQSFERSHGSLPPEHDCESGKVQRRGGVVVIAQFNQLDDQVVEYRRRAWSLSLGVLKSSCALGTLVLPLQSPVTRVTCSKAMCTFLQRFDLVVVLSTTNTPVSSTPHTK